MKTKLTLLALSAVLSVFSLQPSAFCQGTAFTYQGRLNDGVNPADGSYDLKFTLYDAATGGLPQGQSVTNNAVIVNDGLFTVQLDLGNQFNGAPRYLEIGVRTNGSGLFTTLSPRQALLPAPKAIYADNAGSAASIPASAIPVHSITTDKLANGAVGNAQLVAGTLATPVTVASATQAVVPNTSYTATGTNGTIFLLPTTAGVGDTVQVAGVGAGGWRAVNFDVWTPRGNLRTYWHGAASSADGTKLVAVPDGGYIYTSTDSGITWTNREEIRRWSAVASSADGNQLVASAGGSFLDEYLYTSIDSGVTWTHRESRRRWQAVASSADGAKLVAAVNNGQIYTSIDSGANWIPSGPSQPWNGLASSADGVVLVAAAGNGDTNCPLFVSTNSGATWIPRETKTPRLWLAAAASADGTKLVAAAFVDFLFTSSDSGSTWTPRDKARSWSAVASSADGAILLAADSNGRLYTSTDSGVTWNPRGNNSHWYAVASSADGLKMLAGDTGGYLYTGGSGAAGGPGQAATLEYQGNGQWLQALLANGSVGSAQLAPGSVGTVHLAAGAVGTSQLATGAVGSGQLAAGALSPSVPVAAATQVVIPNTSYTATGATPATFQLPTAAKVGDVVQLAATGAGGWIAQNYNPDVWTPRDSARQWTAVASSSDGTRLIAAVDGGKLYISTDSGATWTPQASAKVWTAVASAANGATLVATAAADDLLYGGGAGGPHISADSGATWMPRDRDLPLTTLMNLHWNGAASSADGTKLVAVASSIDPVSETRGALHTSTDSGSTWTVRDSSRAWQAVASSADGTKLVAAAIGGKLYTSIDSGTNWTSRAFATNWSSVASSADGSKLIAAVKWGKLYRSTDSGTNWTEIDKFGPWSSVASSADGTRLAAATWGGQLHNSIDSGVTWMSHMLDDNRQWSSVAMSSDGVKLVAAVYGGQLYTSGFEVSGGPGVEATLQYVGNGQWSPTQLPAGSVGTDQLAAGAVLTPTPVSGATQVAVPNSSYAAQGNNPTTFMLPTTANVGDVVQVNGVGAGGWHLPYYDLSQWTPRDSARNWRALASSADGAKLVAAVSGGYLYTSTDFGTNWTPRALDSARSWTSVASSADGTRQVAAVSGGQLYTSSDSGISWNTHDSPKANWAGVASSADGTKLLAADFGIGPNSPGYLYISTNSGMKWTVPAGGPGAFWQAVASSVDGTKLVAAAIRGQLYTSTNSGETWLQTRDIPYVQWKTVAMSADGTKLVAGTDNGYIYTSTDSGTKWFPRGEYLVWASVASSADGTRLVATDMTSDGLVRGGRVYTSTDCGTNWSRLAGSPVAIWSAVASSADGTKVVAAGNGGQLYTSGTGNEYVGGQGQTATFQYTGNGQWVQRGFAVADLTASGKVGIGTTSPQFPLHVNSSGTGSSVLAALLEPNLADGGFDQIYLGRTAEADGCATFTYHYSDWPVPEGTLGLGFWGNPWFLTLHSDGYVIIDNGTRSAVVDVVGSALIEGGLTSLGDLNVGGTVQASGDVRAKGDVYAGTVKLTSDRNAKENFAPVNSREVLAKVAALPVTQWSFKTQSPGVRHLGPMAQDFHDAFHLGDDDKHISTTDADGVALAAIQGLNQKVEDRSQESEVRSQRAEVRIQQLEAENAQLKARLERLEQLLIIKNGVGQ